MAPKDPRRTRYWREVVVPLVQATYPWVCHLCGQAIPDGVPSLDPMSYEADHILTVGSHPHLAYVITNLRPSHRRCNTLRGGRALTDQLVREITARFAVYEPPALRFFGEMGEGASKLRS